MVNTAPVEFPDSGDIRQFVTHPCGKQQLAAFETVSAAKRQVKGALLAVGGLDKSGPYLHSVRLKLRARNLQEFERVDAISRQIAVKAVRGGISRLSFIADESAAAAPAQNQSRTEPCRPSADYHYVIHLPIDTGGGSVISSKALKEQE
jgi:hypothetical protein